MEKIITVKTEAGRWLAWPKDRLDILANGETKEEAIDNLKVMYEVVMEHESSSCA